MQNNQNNHLEELFIKIERILERSPSNTQAIHDLLKERSDYDIASLLNGLISGRNSVLAALEQQKQLSVLNNVNTHTLRNIIGRMPDHQLIELLEEADNRLRSKLFRHIERARIEAISPKLVEDLKQRLAQHANYAHRSVGYIMQNETLVAYPDSSVADVKKLINEQINTLGLIHQVYITDKYSNYIGVIPLANLFCLALSEKLDKHIVKSLPTLNIHSTQTKAAQIFQDYDLVEVPVLDETKLKGRVVVESIFDVIQQEFTEDIQKLTGISGGDETIETPAIKASKRRLPWMVGNIFLDLLAVTAIMPFEQTIAQVTALAVLMPIISDMGGNIGVQALAVSIRSRSNPRSFIKTAIRELRREFIIGIMNGIVLGLVIGLVGFVGWGSPYLGILVAIAMALNTVIASIMGGFLPILLKKLKLDPALMSGAILTTITDFTGFLIFLWMASRFIHLLT